MDAYYDPFLNITWLADANYAQTSGFDTDGFMTFSQANAWAWGLTLFGGNDWRLPTVTPVNNTGTLDRAFSNNGSTDVGAAKTGIGWDEHSELGYLYYVLLGNNGFYLPNDENPFSLAEVQLDWGLVNTGPFESLIGSHYWTGTVFGNQFAWGFTFGEGLQAITGLERFDSLRGGRAWAVHDGDLLGQPEAPVPVPAAAWLLGSLVAGLVGIARRRVA